MNAADEFRRLLDICGNDPVAALKMCEAKFLSSAATMGAMILGYCMTFNRTLEDAERLMRRERMRTYLLAELPPACLNSDGIAVAASMWKGEAQPYCMWCTTLYGAALEAERRRVGYVSEEDNLRKLTQTGVMTQL